MSTSTHGSFDGCAAKLSVSKLCALHRSSAKKVGLRLREFSAWVVHFLLTSVRSKSPRPNPLLQQCKAGYPDRLRYVYSHKYVSVSNHLTNQIITFPPRVRASSLVSSLSTVGVTPECIEVVSNSPLKGVLGRDHIGRPH